MARTHSVPAIVIELSGEEKLCVAMPSPPPLCLIRKTDLDAIPGFMIDDRLVQTVMDVPLVAKPSDVDRVRKDPVEMAPRHQFAAGPSSCVPRSAEMLVQSGTRTQPKPPRRLLPMWTESPLALGRSKSG